MSKACFRCGETKPFDAFPVLKRVRSGMHPYCLDCRRAYAREYWRRTYKPHPRQRTEFKDCSACRQSKPRADFYPSRGKGADGRQAYCITCTAARQRQRFYGLSEPDFAALVAFQRGRCAICQVVPAKLLVDHCHETGRVRGLLCQGCNTGIARIERTGFLDRAVAYLSRARPLSGNKGQRVAGNRSRDLDARWADATNRVQYQPGAQS